MRNGRIALTILVLVLFTMVAGIQAQKQKYKDPAMMELHDCVLIGFDYTTYTADVQAALPAGYTLDWNEELVTIALDIYQCNDVEIGDGWSIGTATTYHEIVRPVITPDGQYVGFGFPMTNSNPLGKVGFQQVGIPSHPAKDLVAEFEILEEIDDENIVAIGTGFADNHKPFGADMMISFEWDCFWIGTWPEGAAGVQHHAWGKSGKHVKAMSWTAQIDIPHYLCAPPDGEDFPLEVEGHFTFPVVEILPYVIAYDGGEVIVAEEPLP